ncbi:hypothetical protein Pfo_018199 [Paulownia fortunei]|nr:hypothetical protein Pfo_018199 [Paulownia fortunei]
MADNKNRSGVTENYGREPVQTQSKKKRDQSKSREGSSWERVMEDMGERLKIVEHNIEMLEGHVLEQLDSLKENVKACLDADTLRDDRLTRLEANVMDALQAMQISIKTLQEDLAVCKKAAPTGGANTSVVSPRVDYPKPNGFDGRKDAKEVENFLWQMECYFEKYVDIERGSCRVDTWEDFKKELKRHFYPKNVIYEARKKLRELKQRGTTREYVKDFTTIMLQIPNLSEEDLLFHFVDNEGIIVAESFMEYQPHTDASKKKKKKKTCFCTKGGCFVCKGPHAMSNYPKVGSLSAMIERNEATATMDERTSNIESIRLLNALNAKPIPATSSKGLMYVETYLSGKSTRALVDTGATHNFIIEKEVNRLGL